LPEVVVCVVVCTVAAVLLTACGPQYRPIPYVPRSDGVPPVAACHDAVGHVAGSKPWILGGRCCCTPTGENHARHIAEGTLEPLTTYEKYLDLYRQRGIVTDLDHKGCGNMCSKGPHVTLGGRCMATPTPGTWMYDQVTYGPHRKLTLADARAMCSGQRFRASR
jgi:hypothetical protein